MACYFVSDVHAGLRPQSAERFVAWLDAVAADAESIFLLGDVFDFWFEYEHAVPQGFEAILDKFRALTAQGVGIHFFPGNHDMWTLGHLSLACRLIVHTTGYYTTLYDRVIYMEHGDRQSIDSVRERVMQGLFRSSFVHRMARALVPAPWMVRLGNWWSRSNRTRHARPHVFQAENEGIVRFARAYMQTHAVDLFLFGHLHVPGTYALSESTTLCVLGDWIEEARPVYGRLDADGFALLR